MASAGRGEIPPKSVPPLCVWFLFDFFIASNASRRLLTSCGVAAPLPLTVCAEISHKWEALIYTLRKLSNSPFFTAV